MENFSALQSSKRGQSLPNLQFQAAVYSTLVQRPPTQTPWSLPSYEVKNYNYLNILLILFPSVLILIILVWIFAQFETI